MSTVRTGTSVWMIVLVAVIAVLVLADVGYAALRIASYHAPSAAPVAQSGGVTSAGHPCNHGAYVSAAAHAHKGGGYVSKVAKGNLGKNGSCSAPLPAAS
jgi:hypothetical protein